MPSAPLIASNRNVPSEFGSNDDIAGRSIVSQPANTTAISAKATRITHLKLNINPKCYPRFKPSVNSP
jgi:hypothetical protein